MKYILMTFSAVCLALSGMAQTVFIENGALFYIEDPASVNAQSSPMPSVYIEGDIQNNGTLQNNGELQFTGNLNNPGFYVSLGDDVFNGMGLQTFTGNFTAGSNFYNLILNNSGSVSALSNANVEENIVLENSILVTGAATIHLKNTAGNALSGSAVSGSAINYVDGSLRQDITTGQTYSFEVGDFAHGNQIANVLFTNTGGATYMDMGYSSVGAGSIATLNIPTGCIGTYDKSGGTWTATANGANGTYNYAFTAVPGGANLSAIAGSLYDALRQDTTFITDPCDGGFGNYSATGLTSFSAFRILGGPTSALPVNVTVFEGQQVSQSDVLRWTTQQEQNASHFVLSHSKDGVHFAEVAHVNSLAPAGFSALELTYEVRYDQPTTGHNYYRLEQVDLDGQRYMHQQVIDLKRSADGFTSWQLFPNPANGFITARISLENEGKGMMSLTDLSGRTLKSIPLTLIKGSQLVSMDLNHIAPGIYLMHLRNDAAETLTTRFEVIR